MSSREENSFIDVALGAGATTIGGGLLYRAADDPKYKRMMTDKPDVTEVNITGDNMPPITLLSLLSKGKYETSEDLPTMPEMARSYIDNIMKKYQESKQYEPEIKGEGLGIAEWIGGPAKAMAMVAKPKDILNMMNKLNDELSIAQRTFRTVENEIKRSKKLYNKSSTGYTAPYQEGVKSSREIMHKKEIKFFEDVLKKSKKDIETIRLLGKSLMDFVK